MSLNSKAARPAVRSGLLTMMRIVAKAIKKESKHQSIKHTIGFRFTRAKKTNEIWAKVGASVGRKNSSTQWSKSHGKGISKSRNAHWYFVGTPKRPSPMWSKTPKPFPVRDGWKRSRSSALNSGKDKMKQVFTDRTNKFRK